MQVSVTLRYPTRERPGQPQARITLRLEPLRWSVPLIWNGCADPAAAHAAARLYAWYFGYLLYSNAPLVIAHVTRSMVEHSRDGDRVFVEIGLEDGSGALAETVTVDVGVATDTEEEIRAAGEVLRLHGLEVLGAFHDAPVQALALLGETPFYTLPRWLDRALATARNLGRHALPAPAAAVPSMASCIDLADAPPVARRAQ